MAGFTGQILLNGCAGYVHYRSVDAVRF